MQMFAIFIQDSVSMMSGGTVDDTIQNVPRADRIQANVAMAPGLLQS